MRFALLNETRLGTRYAIRVTEDGTCNYFVTRGRQIIRDETFNVDPVSAKAAVSELARIWTTLPLGGTLTAGHGEDDNAPFTKPIDETSAGYFVGVMRSFVPRDVQEIDAVTSPELDAGGIAMFSSMLLIGASLILLMQKLSVTMVAQLHWSLPVFSVLAAFGLLITLYSVGSHRIGLLTSGPPVSTAVYSAIGSLVMLFLGLLILGHDPFAFFRTGLLLIGVSTIGGYLASKKRAKNPKHHTA